MLLFPWCDAIAGDTLRFCFIFVFFAQYNFLQWREYKTTTQTHEKKVTEKKNYTIAALEYIYFIVKKCKRIKAKYSLANIMKRVNGNIFEIYSIFRVYNSMWHELKISSYSRLLVKWLLYEQFYFVCIFSFWTIL